MNFRKLTITLIAGWVSAVASADAPESLRLETEIFVFRNRDFQSVAVPSATAPGTAHFRLLHSPAAIRFDAESLSLDGSRLIWSGGQPPDRLTAIVTPDVSLVAGKPVSFLSAVPAQYVERTADGVLRLREIPVDSSDAPHWRLTFTLGRGIDNRKGVNLACAVEVAMVSARESLPGIRLDVGRPILARFIEKLELEVPLNEWLGALVEPGAEADYNVLVLLKVSRGENSGASTKAAERPMSAREFAQFATYYYRDPRPELVGRAIESLGPSGFLAPESGGDGCVGFFAEVFSANPERVDEWSESIKRRDPRIRAVFRRALELSRSRGVLAQNHHTPAENEMFWGAFFASGDPEYVRKIAAQLKYLSGGFAWRPKFIPAGHTAMLTLASNLTEHPLVREVLEGMLPASDRRTQELIGHLLTKDVEGVRQEIAEFYVSTFGDRPTFPFPDRGGPRASGDFSPMNPHVEPRHGR